MARDEADGARGIRRLDQPDKPADQYDIRVVPGNGQRVMAVLRRSPDGIPDRASRRRARHDIAAESRQALRRSIGPRVREAARLGTAADSDAGAAGRGGAGDTGGTPNHNAGSLLRILGARYGDDT